jgi:hypothetical protein
MRRILILIPGIIIAAYTCCSAQTGEYNFRQVNGDTCVKAQITVGWDYIRVTTTNYSGTTAKSFSVAYTATPDYNFSFGNDGHFWISRSSAALKFLGKYNLKKNKFTYIRLNNKEYR